MINKEQGLEEVLKLVKRFDEQLPFYKKVDYNETQTRQDFINPFFTALGWDMDNAQGVAESYREVIHEDKVKVGGATKAPDYSFRLSGNKRLFFVEAKKPSVVIKDDIQPAYQVRRYGWSAKLAISIITDFEEFAIYDCTKKPNQNDNTSVARIKYLTFTDYEKEWDFLWNTFSKEAVLKGRFDSFIQGTANKKGTATVDKEFLHSLDHWRTILAEAISKENKNLTEDELNFVVQQTIDRIIFLRIAEDRNIEPYGTLKDIVQIQTRGMEGQIRGRGTEEQTRGHATLFKTNASLLDENLFYKILYQQFQRADEKYNSGLFDFKKDTLSKNLVLTNKVLKTIITDLYYPESPYEFSVLSVEILGSAYEQFLGKTITMSPSHRAIIKEKPEVRKAGGVYYTPQYIVNYIVQNTVGKLIEGKTPTQVSEIKIVDPACGSGSFLLGAYQYLLDWHKEYYLQTGKQESTQTREQQEQTRGHAPLLKDKTNKKDTILSKNVLTPEGNLTTNEKKRILLNNIHGVDIDVNAVEVTKLSLLLKCMEGETEASIKYQLTMFNERVLPSLEENIKSGNSLIDTDYYDNQLDFGAEHKKIKPFNWQKALPGVFKSIQIQEELRTFHVTCTTHNSRVSERMKQHKVKKGSSDYLENEYEHQLVEIICRHIRNEELRVLGLNFCADHLHIVLVCNPEKLSFIIGKLKFVTAKEFNIYRGITTSTTTNEQQEQTRGHAPLLQGRGETQHSLWAQKFNHKEIHSESQLKNALEYIQHNRLKHDLPEFPRELQAVIQHTLTKIESAYKPKFIHGGFDVVIGNPPYGAELSKELQEYCLKNYNVGNTDTAALFMVKAKWILKDKGLCGFIIPKSFTFASNWQKTREFILADLQNIVDCGKVWKEVKLEMSVFISMNKGNENKFESFILKERAFHSIGLIEKKLCKEFNFILNGVNKKEISLGLKLKRDSKVLNDFVTNQRGAMYQKEVTEKGELFVLGGKQIGRYSLETVNIKGKIKSSIVKDEKAFINGNSIFVQRIVAHIENPTPHILITATIPDQLNFKKYIILDTINQLTNKSNLSTKFILAIINSQLTSWFVYRFVFANAVRTMQFDNPTTSKIPFPNIDLKNKNHKQSHDDIVKYVEQLLLLNKELHGQMRGQDGEKTRGHAPLSEKHSLLSSDEEQIKRKIDYFEDKINSIVYGLYDLTGDEIKIVEGK